MEWNHFDEKGNAVMVDVSAKEVTERVAVASGKIRDVPSSLSEQGCGGIRAG